MSAAGGILRAADMARTRVELERASFRVRLVKVLCGIALGVCFWYSVPYVFPFVVEHFPEKAAMAESMQDKGSATRQIAVPLIVCISLFLMWRLPLRGKIRGAFWVLPAAYVSWAVMSLAWSVDLSVSMKRLVVFGGDIFCAYTLARVFSMYEIALLAVTANSVVALISLYGDAVYQKIFSVGDPDYRFEGVMEANYQAMSLVVCLLSAITLLERKPQWKKVLVPVIVCGLALLYLTRSRVSTIICLGLFTYMAVRLARKRLKPATQAITLVAAVTVVLPSAVVMLGRNGFDQGVQTLFMMGRNDTQNTSNLSNRGPLWAELFQLGKLRPMQGYGYAAFWTPRRVWDISLDQGWAVPHAHESYIDQTLMLGLIGVALYIGMVWGGAAIAWRRFRRSRSAADLLAAALLIWLAMEGFAESVPIDPYLPSLLAYACVAKMCLGEGTEAESDAFAAPDEVILGLTPGSFARMPENSRRRLVLALEGEKA